jgi:hypothetical protein
LREIPPCFSLNLSIYGLCSIGVENIGKVFLGRLGLTFEVAAGTSATLSSSILILVPKSAPDAAPFSISQSDTISTLVSRLSDATSEMLVRLRDGEDDAAEVEQGSWSLLEFEDAVSSLSGAGFSRS